MRCILVLIIISSYVGLIVWPMGRLLWALFGRVKIWFETIVLLTRDTLLPDDKKVVRVVHGTAASDNCWWAIHLEVALEVYPKSIGIQDASRQPQYKLHPRRTQNRLLPMCTSYASSTRHIVIEWLHGVSNRQCLLFPCKLGDHGGISGARHPDINATI